MNTAIHAVLQLQRAQSYLESRFAAELGSVHGLALNELLLMMYLEHAPQARLRRVDLAARLHLTQSSVTRMVAPMEKTGLVLRESDPRDARVAYVVLTGAGRRRVREAMKTLESLSGEVFADRWTEREIGTLGELLGRLTASLPGQLLRGG
jgi:DNA-binding MarR family transcriptional regulator